MAQLYLESEVVSRMGESQGQDPMRGLALLSRDFPRLVRQPLFWPMLSRLHLPGIPDVGSLDSVQGVLETGRFSRKQMEAQVSSPSCPVWGRPLGRQAGVVPAPQARL